MTYTVVSPRPFAREAAKFFRTHPDLQQRFVRLVTDLPHDPFQPRLKLHPLKGELAGKYAVSLTYVYRITLTIIPEEHTIILLDIGGHDDVYDG